jgi:hypothetical protein
MESFGTRTLEFDKPKASADGHWLLSGKLIVKFKAGPEVPIHGENGSGLHIAVPFLNAANEQEAVHQAAKILEKLGSAIGQVASGLLTHTR